MVPAAGTRPAAAWTAGTGLSWVSRRPTWRRVTPPEIGMEAALIADESGFIAVGARITGLGCAIAPGTDLRRDVELIRRRHVAQDA